MRVQTAEFLLSAGRADQFPAGGRPEVAFAGRSNVGKSSLINRLLGRRALARTSSTPGRTRTINFYAVNDAVLFVDLPGYGYAKVSRGVQEEWWALVEGLSGRAGPVTGGGASHRRAPPADGAGQGIAGVPRGRPGAVHSRPHQGGQGAARHAGRARRTAHEVLGLSSSDAIVFSAETGEGAAELWRAIDAAVTAPPGRREAARRGRGHPESD